MSVIIEELIMEVLPDPGPDPGNGNCVPISEEEQQQTLNQLMELNLERMARLAVD